MRSLLFIGLSATLLSISSKDTTTVYVCGNGTTKVYHLKESCQGMKRCSHETIKMKRSEASAKGLRLCGYED